MIKNINESYDNIIDKWYEYRKKSEINKCIVDFCKYLKKKDNILDVGCGTAYPISYYLSSNDFNVTGIDVSKKMIEKAKKLNLPNANFILCDLLEYNVNIKYDAIIAFDSLWHIPYEKQRDIYPKISSLLKNNGYFLFTHGKVDGEIIGTMYDEEFYYSALDLEEVYKLLKENDFNIELSIENYKEKTTGERDLLIIAKKH